MKTTKNVILRPLACLFPLVLTACGGGGNAPPINIDLPHPEFFVGLAINQSPSVDKPGCHALGTSLSYRSSAASSATAPPIKPTLVEIRKGGALVARMNFDPAKVNPTSSGYMWYATTCDYQLLARDPVDVRIELTRENTDYVINGANIPIGVTS